MVLQNIILERNCEDNKRWNRRNLEKLNKERGRNRENKKLNTEIPKPEKACLTRSEKPDVNERRKV